MAKYWYCNALDDDTNISEAQRRRKKSSDCSMVCIILCMKWSSETNREKEGEKYHVQFSFIRFRSYIQRWYYCYYFLEYSSASSSFCYFTRAPCCMRNQFTRFHSKVQATMHPVHIGHLQAHTAALNSFTVHNHFAQELKRQQ